MVPFFRRGCVFLFYVAVTVYLVTFFVRDSLPPPEKAVADLQQDPRQTPTKAAPFEVKVDDKIYHITPRFDYEIWGMIASYHNRGERFDMFTKFDPFNLRDDCVVWGKNITSNFYRQASFRSGDFTCYVRGKSGGFPDYNIGLYLSNNHWLPRDPEMGKRIRAARIGDQIHVKGYLVDYRISDTTTGLIGGSRNTSTVRDDQGCEIVYITDYSVLTRGKRTYAMLHRFSGWTALFLLVILVSFIIRETPKPGAIAPVVPPEERFSSPVPASPPLETQPPLTTPLPPIEITDISPEDPPTA
jgi:hypothetical protein